MTAGDADSVLRSLARRDPRLGRVIRDVGPYQPDLVRDPFRALVYCIVQQQVSMSAGAAIQRRLRALCPGRRLTPRAILRRPTARLRGAGLSRQKAEYVRGVARAFADRTLTAPALRRMSDDDVIAATTQLKGVGRWTAEMLLIFCLERPDVWPVDDLGLRRAVQLFYGWAEMPKAKEIADLADPWRPYRSYATWYLWQSLKLPAAWRRNARAAGE